MLKIENTKKLLNEIIIINGNKHCGIFNIEELEDHYAIYVRDDNGPFGIVTLILKRNRTYNKAGWLYDYYTMYNSDIPNNRLDLPKGLIADMNKFMNGIKTILEMK